MAAAGTIASNMWRRRVQTRLVGYGSVALILAFAALTGYLERPLFPLLLVAGGLAFAIPAKRFAPIAFAAAVVFDAVAVVSLALMAGSWLAGGLAVLVAAATMTIGRPLRTVVPVAGVALGAMVVLTLGEQGVIDRPAFLPTILPPANAYAALCMSVVLAVIGIAVVKQLVALYGRAAIGVEDTSRRWWGFMEATDRAVIVSTDGRIQRVNEAAAELTGRGVDDLRGMHVETILDGDRVVRPDGSVAHVSRLTAPMAIDGKLSEVLFLVDVSGDEEHLRHLESTIRETDRFVASVSHEVRTPLTAVVGLSSVVDEAWDELSTAEHREFVRIIAAQSKEVAAIIEDLLVAARAGTSGVRVELSRVALHDETAQVVSTIDFESRSVTTEGTAIAWADAGRVRQIVRNLLTNAVRYGGPRIAVTMSEEDDMVRLEVADDGSPIPEPARERIFQPFTRATETGRRHDSVGLGLTVSRQLAELMHGSLGYDHTDGWSRFTLTLPRPPG